MSSISSRSLSMSSLIFLPFLASSGLAAAPSPPPSDGFVGRVSFFFCSAMRPSIGARDGVHDRPVTSSPLILTEAQTPQYLCYPPGSALEVLAQAQRLMLVGGAQPDPVDAPRPATQPLEPHLEGGLAVVDQ